MAAITRWMGERSQTLRRQIQTDDSLEMALRAALSALRSSASAPWR